MADEFQLGNWWDSPRNRLHGGTTTPPASISTTLNAIASVGWAAEDMKTGQLHGGGDVLVNPHWQNMRSGLPSESVSDWNVQALLGDEVEDSSTNDFKQINRGFSIDQSQASSNDSTITSQKLTVSFQVNAAAASYGLLLSENQQHSSSYESQPISYTYPSGGYGWHIFPPPLTQTPPPLAFPGSASPFWNASAAVDQALMARPVTSPAFGIPLLALAPSLDEKPTNKSTKVQDSSTTTKKNKTETSNKRQRSETPPSLPPFKVRKEKMGDRISVLQQLVSPFGKTDTASVLSEATEYIKFLHAQINALSAPYLRNGAPIQHQQLERDEGRRKDLTSVGLCLVPVSSASPVTHETPVDFNIWKQF